MVIVTRVNWWVEILLESAKEENGLEYRLTIPDPSNLILGHKKQEKHLRLLLGQRSVLRRQDAVLGLGQFCEP